MKAWMSSNFDQIPPPTPELTAHACLRIDVLCFKHSSAFIFDRIFFLQVSRTTIKSRMRSKVDQIRPWTAELAALERLEKSP